MAPRTRELAVQSWRPEFEPPVCMQVNHLGMTARGPTSPAQRAIGDKRCTGACWLASLEKHGKPWAQ